MKFSFLIVSLLILAPAAPVRGDERPNLVFLLTDDQSFDTLGSYGNDEVTTPHIDRLAADGMAFDKHYDTTAICMASRASILTGMFEYRTGCNFGHGHLLESHWKKSYPMLLRKAGYHTAFAGKFGVEIAREPGGKGYLPEEDFDRWGGGPGQTSYDTARNKSMANYAKEFPHSTLSYGAFGRDFIRDYAGKEKPFCLSISFKAPHHPTTPDPQFDDVYKGKTFTRPENYGRDKGTHFSEQSRQGRQYARFEEWGYADHFDEVMATYHQQIYAVDVAVGMIREALETEGEGDNTVIIFTSDNGFLCGSHGYGSKVLPYEESSRVPLIVYHPGHENSGKQLRCNALTGNVDIAPTLLELAGAEIPPSMDGKSLMTLYRDPGSVIHESLPLINVWGAEEVHSFGVVTRDWKLVRWPFSEGGFQATEELFFVGEDPLEMHNLIRDPAHSSALERMHKLYDGAVRDWQKRAVPYHDYQRFGTIFDRHHPGN